MPSLNHVPQCHISTSFKYLQRWWLHYVSAQPVLMLDNLPWHNLKPFSLALSLATWGTKQKKPLMQYIVLHCARFIKIWLVYLGDVFCTLLCAPFSHVAVCPALSCQNTTAIFPNQIPTEILASLKSMGLLPLSQWNLTWLPASLCFLIDILEVQS